MAKPGKSRALGKVQDLHPTTHLLDPLSGHGWTSSPDVVEEVNGLHVLSLADKVDLPQVATLNDLPDLVSQLGPNAWDRISFLHTNYTNLFTVIAVWDGGGGWHCAPAPKFVQCNNLGKIPAKFG